MVENWLSMVCRMVYAEETQLYLSEYQMLGGRPFPSWIDSDIWKLNNSLIG